MQSRLAISTLFAFVAIFVPNTHQGKWHDWSLKRSHSRPTPHLGRFIAELPPMTTEQATISLVGNQRHIRRAPLVSRATFLAWLKVATCETGRSWRMVGPIYSGALGILNSNWLAYAPRSFPRNASLATPMQQVYVASIINRGFAVPDQYGCSGGW